MKSVDKFNRAIQQFNLIIDDFAESSKQAVADIEKEQLKAKKAERKFEEVRACFDEVFMFLTNAVSRVEEYYESRSEKASVKADENIAEIRETQARAERIAERLGELLK